MRELLHYPDGLNIEVSYRIVAKRKDFADERLKKVALPSMERLGLK
jgi:hypothetical protein